MPKNKSLLSAIAAILICWALLYRESIRILLMRWNSEDYSYCYLVPLLAVFIALSRRKEIPEPGGAGSLAGYLGLISAIMLFLAGRLGSLETLVYLSLWLSIASVTVLFLGVRSLKALAFPLLVLLFIIPAPPFLTQMFTFQLRVLSSSIAVEVFHLLGISAYREGNIIDLGVTQLQVVDACSGLRYVIPTILVALIMGHFFNRKIRERIALVVLAIPVSILINSLRIVAQPLLSQYVSPAFGEGYLHGFYGWLVFILSLFFLFLCSRVLSLFSMKGRAREVEKRDEKSGVALADTEPGLRQSKTRLIHMAAVALIFLCAWFLQAKLVSGKVSPPRAAFEIFPVSLAGWEGVRSYLDKEILDSLWADDYVTLTFHNRQTGNYLNLLVAWYSYQTTQHTAHAPASCLMGSGWDLRTKQRLPPNPANGRSFPVQQMLLEKGGQSLLSNFWFQERGRTITSEYLNKAYLFYDSVTKGRTDGALVRVEMAMVPGQSVEDAQKVMDGFTVELKKILGPYVPG
jgi:exosortase D (VPLPA-CTERM-specific)